MTTEYYGILRNTTEYYGVEILVKEQKEINCELSTYLTREPRERRIFRAIRKRWWRGIRSTAGVGTSAGARRSADPVAHERIRAHEELRCALLAASERESAFTRRRMGETYAMAEEAEEKRRRGGGRRTPLLHRGSGCCDLQPVLAIGASVVRVQMGTQSCQDSECTALRPREQPIRGFVVRKVGVNVEEARSDVRGRKQSQTTWLCRVIRALPLTTIAPSLLAVLWSESSSRHVLSRCPAQAHGRPPISIQMPCNRILPSQQSECQFCDARELIARNPSPTPISVLAARDAWGLPFPHRRAFRIIPGLATIHPPYTSNKLNPRTSMLDRAATITIHGITNSTPASEYLGGVPPFLFKSPTCRRRTQQSEGSIAEWPAPAAYCLVPQCSTSEFQGPIAVRPAPVSYGRVRPEFIACRIHPFDSGLDYVRADG
ncbi:hypothetical protein DFH09DRAFT_1092231 [Mycena vulgaris]|nr:hypothetical protein DFH09DRAFT_1092231 [Mycena vulgaris]